MLLSSYWNCCLCFSDGLSVWVYRGNMNGFLLGYPALDPIHPNIHKHTRTKMHTQRHTDVHLDNHTHSHSNPPLFFIQRRWPILRLGSSYFFLVHHSLDRQMLTPIVLTVRRSLGLLPVLCYSTSRGTEADLMCICEVVGFSVWRPPGSDWVSLLGYTAPPPAWALESTASSRAYSRFPK